MESGAYGISLVGFEEAGACRGVSQTHRHQSECTPYLSILGGQRDVNLQ
jgi:hypothetical protein